MKHLILYENFSYIEKLIKEFLEEAEKHPEWFFCRIGLKTAKEKGETLGECGVASAQFINWLKTEDQSLYSKAKLLGIFYPDPYSPKTELAHYVVEIRGFGLIDLTADQFDFEEPFHIWKNKEEIINQIVAPKHRNSTDSGYFDYKPFLQITN